MKNKKYEHLSLKRLITPVKGALSQGFRRFFDKVHETLVVLGTGNSMRIFQPQSYPSPLCFQDGFARRTNSRLESGDGLGDEMANPQEFPIAIALKGK